MLDILTMLERAPAPFRRFAYRVAAGRGVLGRLADSVRFRVDDDAVPALPEPADASVRLLIGPANTAGQGYEWARAVEQYVPDSSALAMHGVVPDPFHAKVDLSVPMAAYKRSESWHAAFEEYLAGRTHVIWESGLPLLGRRYGSDVVREMRLFADRGVGTALLFHGSDIRPPARHMAQHRWSPFGDPRAPVGSLEDGAAMNATLAARADVPVFVSTPDLLQWVPGATWCPVVVDPARWRIPATERPQGPLVVAHAPSQKWLKGTDSIEPMLRRLHDEGAIEYRHIVDIPHTTMAEFYADADVVLDQFLLGSYGVAACEAMASGRLVLGHVDEPTRRSVREHTGLELPVYEATVESLESQLRLVVNQPEAFETLRIAGPAFVDAVHSGRYSANAMATFLGVTV